MNYLATSCVPLLMAALATPAHADAWWLESQVEPPLGGFGSVALGINDSGHIR